MSGSPVATIARANASASTSTKSFMLTFVAMFVACSSRVPDAGLTWTGSPGRPASAVIVSDVLLPNVTVDGKSGARVLADTGSPIVILNPASFEGASVPTGAGSVDTLAVAGVTITHPAVVGANLIASPNPTVPIAGVLGCTVICSFATSFNYRDSEVTLGQAPLPASLELPGVAIPFRLEGGGTAILPNVAQTVDFPPSRITVTVILEGVPHPMMIDTAASYVFLREEVFTQLTSDHRGELGGLSTSSINGASTSTVARARSVAAAGAEVTDIVVSEDPSLEGLLDSLATEVGHPVDGLLGGTYLREFYVTVDYPAQTLELRRYTSLDFLVDEFERLGVSVDTPDEVGARVSQVFPETDAAAKGILVGDTIVAVDGKPLARLGVGAATTLLSGSIGTTKVVSFGAAGDPQLAHESVAIRVDDLLPLPPPSR